MTISGTPRPAYVFDGTDWVPVSGGSTDFTYIPWTTYTPTLTASTTNPTLGSGSTVFGSYSQVGKIVTVKFMFIFGSSGTNAGSGTYRVSLPVTPVGDSIPSGNIFIFDSSTSNAWTGCMGSIQSAGYMDQIWYASGGALASVSESNPMAWSASDQIRGLITYEAA